MKPNLIVIGAMKCGTTSLHYYLDAHPQISMSRPKELHYFTGPEEEREVGLSWKLNLKHTWHLGPEWYESRFVGTADVYGESSPGYAYYPRFRDVPRRMHAAVPDAKLVYIVRDPIRRIVSHYVMAYSSGKLDGSIDDVLRDFETNPANPFVCGSLYAMQLERYLGYYSKDRILVLSQENLQVRRQETLRRVFRFLGVEESFESWKFQRVLHESSWRRRRTRAGDFLKRAVLPNVTGWIPQDLRYRVDQILLRPFSTKIESPTLDPVLRGELAEFFRSDTARLRELTGEPFAEWSI